MTPEGQDPGMGEPDRGEDGNDPGRGEVEVTMAAVDWLLKVLRKVWNFDPVPRSRRKKTSALMGILSAAGGLYAAMAVAVLAHLDRTQDIFELLASYAALGVTWKELVTIARSYILLVAAPAPLVLFVGAIVYHSEHGRSYIGYFWQGAVVIVGGIVLFLIASMIWALFKLVG